MTRKRRGTAMLLAMLTAAVVATAAIAVIRAVQRQSHATQRFEQTVRGDHEVRGLLEMTIAILRQNPAFSGEVRDKAAGSSEAYGIVSAAPNGDVFVDLYAFANAKIPAKSIQLDPSLLKR
jgi:hypothetical protein